MRRRHVRQKRFTPPRRRRKTFRITAKVTSAKVDDATYDRDMKARRVKDDRYRSGRGSRKGARDLLGVYEILVREEDAGEAGEREWVIYRNDRELCQFFRYAHEKEKSALSSLLSGVFVGPFEESTERIDAVSLDTTLEERVLRLNEILSDLVGRSSVASSSGFRSFFKSPIAKPQATTGDVRIESHNADLRGMSPVSKAAAARFGGTRSASTDAIDVIIEHARRLWERCERISGRSSTAIDDFLRAVRENMTERTRPLVWLRCSGALELEASVVKGMRGGEGESGSPRRDAYIEDLLRRFDREADKTECSSSKTPRIARQIRVDAPRSGISRQNRCHGKGDEDEEDASYKRRCDALQRILRAYAVRNPDVGYVQGMNILVAAFFAAGMGEIESFWMLAVLVEQWMPSYFDGGLLGVRVDMDIVLHLVHAHMPRLARRIEHLGLDCSIFLTSMFVTLLRNNLDDAHASRVWDVMFLLGPGRHVVLSVVMSFFEECRPFLMRARNNSEIEQTVMMRVRSWRRRADIADILRSSLRWTREIDARVVARNRRESLAKARCGSGGGSAGGKNVRS
eukprot:g3141.t1